MTSAAIARMPGMDALRGVAALGIVTLHGMNLFHAPRLLHHAYLAVDFFFMLSGYVLAHAYQERLRRGLGFGAFVAARAIRLYPMIALGVLVGVAAAILQGKFASETAVAAISGITLVPLPGSGGAMDDIFAINAPLWSLFWEMAASLAFAAALYRWSNRKLRALQLAALALLVVRAIAQGSLETGFAWAQFADGGLRVAFGFVTGMLLWRRDAERAPQPTGGVVLAALLLFATLAGYSDDHAWLYDLGAVTIVFPLTVRAAARAVRAGVWGKIAGELSYPLYAIHLPLLTMLAITLQADVGRAPSWLLAGGIALSLVAARAAQRCWDEPLRRRLHALSHKKKGPRHAPKPLPVQQS